MSTAPNYSSLGAARLLGAYLGDIKFEFLSMMRMPAFAVPTLFFPAMFYVLFAVIMGRGNEELAMHTFARMGVFGVMAPGLFGFGMALAFERENGLMNFRQALPTPPGSALVARMVMAMLFAGCISLLLTLLAVFLADAPLTVWQAAKVFVIEVLGVLPFCAIGLFVGSMVSGQAAPAIVNVIYLPMAFLSGLWVPLQILSQRLPVLMDIAPLWPSFHLSQIALHAIGKESYGSMAGHIGALAGITLLFFTLAVRKLSNGGVRLFGARRRTAGFQMGRAMSVGVVFISIGLVIAGAMGGQAKVPAATSKAAAERGDGSPVIESSSAAPVGVAAPETTSLGDFDAGSSAVGYGAGWFAADDTMRGGNSTAALKFTKGGAENSTAAMEVAGTVGDAIQYPFGGTVFFPNGKEGTDLGNAGFMDYSRRQTLRFDVRGDDKSYLVLFTGPVVDAIPAMYDFTAGPEWKEVRIPLRELGGLDLERVRMIGIGTMQPGPFRFEIDNVRIE